MGRTRRATATVGAVVRKCALFSFRRPRALRESVVVVVARVVVDGGAVGEVETLDERHFAATAEVKDEAGVLAALADDDARIGIGGGEGDERPRGGRKLELRERPLAAKVFGEEFLDETGGG